MDSADIPALRPMRTTIAIHLDELQALQALRAGRKDAALAGLERAAAAEKAMPYQFGPPTIRKATFELLGDVQLELGNPAAAARAYRSALELAPGRVQSLEGLRRAQSTLATANAGKPPAH